MCILRRTENGDNVRIGAHSIVMPGSKIGNNCILAASSTTTVSQELEEGWIYLGVPAKKYKKNLFFRDGLEHLLLRDEDVVDLKKKYDLLYTKRVDKEKSEAN
jgi:carbonic anhydrase/acetyltransferase-like protein (isoleucine patch superfamily)